MKFFPKVTSLCPYKGALADIMEGDTCRLCKKAVHDITDWSEDAKQALLANCSEEVCVTYRVDARPALAAVAAGAAVMVPTSLAAQEASHGSEATENTVVYQSYSQYESNFTPEEEELHWIFVGGVRKDGVEFEAEADVRKGRELPVEYDDAPAEKETDEG